MRRGNTDLTLRLFINAKNVVISISVDEVSQNQNKTQTITHFKIQLFFNINVDEYSNKYLH